MEPPLLRAPGAQPLKGRVFVKTGSPAYHGLTGTVPRQPQPGNRVPVGVW